MCWKILARYCNSISDKASLHLNTWMTGEEHSLMRGIVCTWAFLLHCNSCCVHCYICYNFSCVHYDLRVDPANCSRHRCLSYLKCLSPELQCQALTEYATNVRSTRLKHPPAYFMSIIKVSRHDMSLHHLLLGPATPTHSKRNPCCGRCC